MGDGRWAMGDGRWAIATPVPNLDRVAIHGNHESTSQESTSQESTSQPCINCALTAHQPRVNRTSTAHQPRISRASAAMSPGRIAVDHSHQSLQSRLQRSQNHQDFLGCINATHRRNRILHPSCISEFSCDRHPDPTMTSIERPNTKLIQSQIDSEPDRSKARLLEPDC
jgi:hypothetical protein